MIEVNELQKRRVIGKLQKHLGSLVGKRVALLGLAFKPNTDDMREATSLVLSARLQAAGAHVGAYDPVAEDEARELISGVELRRPTRWTCVDGADAVVLVTEWQEFTELDWRAVADGDGAATLARSTGATRWTRRPSAPPGSTYEGVGRPMPASQPVAATMQAVILVGGRGHAPAPADLDRAQAGRAARRPAVHRLHARVAARATASTT